MKNVFKVFFIGVFLIILIPTSTEIYAKERTALYEMKMVKTEIKDLSEKK